MNANDLIELQALEIEANHIYELDELLEDGKITEDELNKALQNLYTMANDYGWEITQGKYGQFEFSIIEEGM